MKLVFLSVSAIAVISGRANSTAWAWGNPGHEIVAIIAADNLLPTAREQVARILGTGSNTRSLEKAMAAASVALSTSRRSCRKAGRSDYSSHPGECRLNKYAYTQTHKLGSLP